MSRINILVMNFKGGAAKSTTANLLASYIDNKPLLIEVDKINKSDEKINTRDFYTSVQLDWNIDTSSAFEQFEDYLLQDGIKIIDVGAVKLEVFHNTMKSSGNYHLIDILILPAMDGWDDFTVGLKMFENIADYVSADKILVGFNRYNPSEYESVEEQFDAFFENADQLKKLYKFDLKANYFTIQESLAIKKARKIGETVRYFADQDPTEARVQAQNEVDPIKRKKLQTKRRVIQKANELKNNSIIPMLKKVNSKLAVFLEEK